MGRQIKDDVKFDKHAFKLNPDMRHCGEIKTHWCGGCEAGKGNLLHKVGTMEFKSPTSCCIQTIDLFIRGLE